MPHRLYRVLIVTGIAVGLTSSAGCPTLPSSSATPEAFSDASPESTLEPAPNGPEASPEVIVVDLTPEASPDASPDAAPESISVPESRRVCPIGFTYGAPDVCTRITVLSGLPYRTYHTATLDDQNRVLIVDADFTDTHLITPTSIINGPELPNEMGVATAAKLSSGEILIVGGWSPEAWRINTQTFQVNYAFPLRERRHSHVMYRNASNELVIIGGRKSPNADSDSFEVIGDGGYIEQNITRAALDPRIVSIGNGRHIVFRGRDGETFQIIGNEVTPFEPPPTSPFHAGVIYLQDRNLLLLVGGTTDEEPETDAIWGTNPGSGSWELMGNLKTARSHFPLIQDATGRILAIGGRGVSNISPVETIEALVELESGYFESVAIGSLSEGRELATATKFDDGTLVFVGGRGTEGWSGAVEIFEAVPAVGSE